MALPDLIEIVPLETPVRAEITVPGSKSITNRALVLAALADGEVTLEGALWSEDTQIMVECLQDLGFMVNVEPDPNEFCNRTITVYGKGGKIPNGGTPENPLELFVGNAGTAARFLSAMVCLGNGVYRLHGVPRMHERPQAALFTALRELGYDVKSEKGNDKLPVLISSSRRHQSAQTATVSIEESSQFASALLLCAKFGGWHIKVVGENAEESPYVAMTTKLIEAFPHRGGSFQIEPDASSGSYFWGAGWLLAVTSWMKDFLENTPYPLIQVRFDEVWEKIQKTYSPNDPTGSNQFLVVVNHWPVSDWQIDSQFPVFIPLPARISREDQLGDSIMTAVVLAAHVWGGLGLERREKGIQFVDLGRLRLQECDRVSALRTELKKCGSNIVEKDDSLTVYQATLHGAEIETYNDHRMAMCFAVLGLKVPGIKLKNPSCVKKTFPNFFQKLATPPPHGLGVTILDGKTGRKLGMDELFAE